MLVVIRNNPLGVSSGVDTALRRSPTMSSICRQRGSVSAPAGVRLSRRVVRCNSRTPTHCSISARYRDTMALDMSKCTAAADKLSVGDLDKHLHGFQAIHDCLESCIRRFRLYRISMHFPYMRYGKGAIRAPTVSCGQLAEGAPQVGLHLASGPRRMHTRRDARSSDGHCGSVRKGYSSPCTPCTSQGSVSPSKQTRPFRRNRPCPYRS